MKHDQFLKAARACYRGYTEEGFAGYAPYYVNAALSVDDYYLFQRVFRCRPVNTPYKLGEPRGAHLFGDEAVIAICFAAAMAEAGDL